jgi:hypothetical protein
VGPRLPGGLEPGAGAAALPLPPPRVTLRSVEQCAQLTQARGELAWLADLPAQSAQQVLRQLDHAYDNWWTPQHAAGPPTFKKRRNRLVAPFPGQAVKVRRRNRKRHRRSAGPQRPPEGRAEPRRPRQRPLRAAPPAGLQGAPVRLGAAAGAAGVHLAGLFGVRAPRSTIAAGLRAGVRLHRLRPPGARRPPRRTEHRTDCRRTGGRQHAQSPSGGEARTEPHA